MDDKLLQVLNAKCKVHRVGFNSGFLGITNLALLKLMREAGIVRDTDTISSLHAMDARRYTSDVKSMVWGDHHMNMTQTIKISWNVMRQIWNNE